jgi:hypothetical protein
MKDWPELVLSLIAELGEYVCWLDDFKEGANAEQLAAIEADQARCRELIRDLKAHKVDEKNPHLDRLLNWLPNPFDRRN